MIIRSIFNLFRSTNNEMVPEIKTGIKTGIYVKDDKTTEYCGSHIKTEIFKHEGKTRIRCFNTSDMYIDNEKIYELFEYKNNPCITITINNPLKIFIVDDPDQDHNFGEYIIL